MGLIGISGKIGSGKDTVGLIIQYLTMLDFNKFETLINLDQSKVTHEQHFKLFAAHGLMKDSNWEIKRFAGKVKEICSILTGIPVEDFEKQEVKNRILGEEWKCYVRTLNGQRMEISLDRNYIKDKTVRLSEWAYRHGNASDNHNWDEHTITVRELLQLVSTDAMRNVIHPNVWVNALFADYLNTYVYAIERDRKLDVVNRYGNWIITDTRFPNEAEAIKSRGGLLIRVNRDWKVQRRKELEATLPDEIYTLGDDIPSDDERKIIVNTGKGGKIQYELALEEEMRKQAGEHLSETSLDQYEFGEYVDNNGSIEELVEKVKLILIKHKII